MFILLLAQLRFAPTDVPSVFYIGKSENKNQVHYALQLDERCAPRGAAPVFGYWRNLEKGPSDLSPLLGIEQPAYGIATQSVSGNTVRVTLRALPERPIAITARKEAGGCSAVASVRINGAEARLRDVWVKLAWPLGVDHLLVTGWNQSGQPVREMIKR
jgi:hypothetical protein